jgi:hypothetical protein
MTATLATSDLESRNSRHLMARKVGLPLPARYIERGETLASFLVTFPGNVDATAADEKIQICAFVGLGNVVVVEFVIAPI